MEKIMDVSEFRKVVKDVFSYYDEIQTNKFYRTKFVSVIDTEWTTEGDELVAWHYGVDIEPVKEVFHFPPSWSNMESWRNTFESDYPECAADALDIALWTARTPTAIIIEQDNGIRVIKSSDTDPVLRVEERRIKPATPPIKRRKAVYNHPSMFGESNV